MIKFKFTKNLFIILLSLAVICAIFILYEPDKKEGGLSKNSYVNISADVKDFESRHFVSFDDLKYYFQELARKKRADYAFEVLKVASVPPDTDMHLLAHAVGDVLYKQEGLNGIKICTNDFRNACSHSIVVGLFYDRGDGAFPEIAQACRQAPGGKGAYTMCFHGLGHGILAALGYDLEKAIDFCKKTGTSEYGHNESSQCVGGTIMEIVGGGDHDRELWSKQRTKYLTSDNPLYPCNADFMPAPARYLCYSYLTPNFFDAVGGNRGHPTSDDFKKSFKLCNKLPIQDKSNRNACYGGFGKEFIGLVQSRDIRRDSVASITDEQLDQIYRWCQLADNKEGVAACILQGLSSLYWGGENDPQPSFRFCGLIDDQYFQQSCYRQLVSSAFYYSKEPDYLKSFCQKLPDSYRGDCLARTANIK